MPELMPFRGIRYDEAVAGGLERNIAPPYDVVDDGLYKKLLAASPYNAVRLTLPAGPSAHEGGAADPASFQRAALLLRQWLWQGILRRDDKPAIYVYDQRFALQGQTHSRTGFVALMRLVEFGKGIRPHERTLSAPKQDRLKLLRATKANFGQVFALYEDETRRVDRLLDLAKAAPPLAAAGEGIHHSLWAITDPARLQRIETLMRNAEIFIADGHHRYETALNYMHETPDSPAARYRMMTFVNMSNPGLVVLPTHRLVHGLPGFDGKLLLKRLEAQFAIERLAGDDVGALVTRLQDKQRARRRAFGLYFGDGNYYIAVLRDLAAMDAAPVQSPAWKRLDVAILHSLVLEAALGIKPEAVAAGRNIEYVKDLGDFGEDSPVAEAARKVREGRAQAVFFLNPARVEDVAAVAREGEKMPQKSTFFYPKVYTGLVMRMLDDDPK